MTISLKIDPLWDLWDNLSENFLILQQELSELQQEGTPPILKNSLSFYTYNSFHHNSEHAICGFDECTAKHLTNIFIDFTKSCIFGTKEFRIYPSVCNALAFFFSFASDLSALMKTKGEFHLASTAS